MEKPITYIMKNTPIKDTGIAVNGIKVERQSRRKMKIIKATKAMAMKMVSSTSVIDFLTYCV